MAEIGKLEATRERPYLGLLVCYFPLLDGRIDYNEMLDMQISQGAKPRERGGAETIGMLAELQFPTTRRRCKISGRHATSSTISLTRSNRPIRPNGTSPTPS